MILRAIVETVGRVLQHGVEHADRDAMRAQYGCGIERAQRRVRLHLPDLLRVVGKMIRMSEQNICHGSPQLHVATVVSGAVGQSRANGASTHRSVALANQSSHGNENLLDANSPPHRLLHNSLNHPTNRRSFGRFLRI